MQDNHFFDIQEEDGFLTALRHTDDASHMNWLRSGERWGVWTLPPGLEGEVHRETTPRGTLRETYRFTNTSAYDVFAAPGDVGITIPLCDSYPDAQTCMQRRCHVHIWCGHTSSYVCALRMGGQPPHLGLVLTRGCLCGYGQDHPHTSNDRGSFTLYAAPFQLLPGEVYELEWELFWHEGREDFQRKLMDSPQYIDVTSAKFLYFLGEDVHLSARASDVSGEILVRRGEEEVPYSIKDGRIDVFDRPETVGEYCYTFWVDGVQAQARVFVQAPFEELLRSRCWFIARRQQYARAGSHLDGAFLTYDNETNLPIYYHGLGDQNGGRERVGMGVLLAKYLQWQPDEALYGHLMRYLEFVQRELVDVKTGIVYDEVTYCLEQRVRPYNDPWMSVLFLECYHLTGDGHYLLYMYRVLRAYYMEHGGARFYGIHIPMVQSLSALRQAGLLEEADELQALFLRHGETLAQIGLDYPAHEVNYEQSIVAPAACLMAQLYEITGDTRWREEALRQFSVLAPFQGWQPDHRLYEVSIRHWDGFWFGKHKCYGDTFPHHWSSLSGGAFYAYYRMTRAASAQAAAEASLRAPLSLFTPDGRASCAYLYPLRINGQPGHWADPWANDQDWALYSYLDYLMREDKLPALPPQAQETAEDPTETGS